MKNQDINKTIDIIKYKNKSRIEFSIFLIVIIVLLYIFLYILNISLNIKKILLILLVITEITFLVFNILIIINNNKLKKLIDSKKIYFNNKIQSTDDQINISGLLYKKDKSLSQEDIDRIDIFSKEERIINTNNLIEGQYKDIYFKSYNIEIIDNKKVYGGKWIELNTLIKDNISTYICKKDDYLKELVYPKNIFEEIKDKNNKIFIKNQTETVDYLIELQKELDENIYISIINDKFQVLVFKDNNEISIERDIKRIYKYLEVIHKYKDKLLLCDKINTGD